MIYEIDLPLQVPAAASREDISSNDLSNPQPLVKKHAMLRHQGTLMPHIICSKYADMLNDDRTLFQNPSCAIIVWIPGRSGTIFNYQSPCPQRNLKGTCSSNCCLRCDTLTCLPVSHTKSIGAQAFDPYPKWDRTSLVTGWCCGPRWEHWEHRLMILFQKLDFCLQLLNHLLFEFSETKQEAELWLELSSMDFQCKQAILTERDHPQQPTRR